MTSSEADLNRVRDFVARIRSQIDPEQHRGYEETILLREQVYCGRCIYFDGMRAIWFAEDKEVKLYDSHRKVLAAVPVAASGLPVEDELIAKIEEQFVIDQHDLSSNEIVSELNDGDASEESELDSNLDESILEADDPLHAASDEESEEVVHQKRAA